LNKLKYGVFVFATFFATFFASKKINIKNL